MKDLEAAFFLLWQGLTDTEQAALEELMRSLVVDAGVEVDQAALVFPGQ